jgi:hypothetical protein
MAKLSISEALLVSAEARAVLGSAAGPAAQEKARVILDGALEALTGYAVDSKPDVKLEKPKKSEVK